MHAIGGRSVSLLQAEEEEREGGEGGRERGKEGDREREGRKEGYRGR